STTSSSRSSPATSPPPRPRPEPRYGQARLLLSASVLDGVVGTAPKSSKMLVVICAAGDAGRTKQSLSPGSQLRSPPLLRNAARPVHGSSACAQCIEPMLATSAPELAR